MPATSAASARKRLRKKETPSRYDMRATEEMLVGRHRRISTPLASRRHTFPCLQREIMEVNAELKRAEAETARLRKELERVQ